MSSVSIIIVNYNCSKEIEKCVLSLRKACREQIEIVLVDNFSNNEEIKRLNATANKFDCIVVHLARNLGFAAGCNAGAERSNGKWLHFLNPDCEVEFEISLLYSHLPSMAKNKVYTTKMTDNFGVIYNNVYAVPKFLNLIKILIGLDGLYWAQGSSIIIYRDNFLQIGCWDEKYFMYAEDLDICYRAALNGFMLEKLDYFVKHVGGASTSNLWSSYERLCRVYFSQILFYKKYGNGIEYLVVSFLLLFRSFIKNKKFNYLEWKAFFKSVRYIGWRHIV
jgi:N-acetylglucosaminyl-diphospho-decaprenol L-rhamnosyltransferase